MRASQKSSRLIALDPTRRGFAYVLLEVPHNLIDWGIVQAEGAACVKRLEELLRRLTPESFILEDYTASECRRSQSSKDFLWSLEMLALVKGLGVVRVGRRAVRERFAPQGAGKQAIATALADLFPELRPRLPRVRKAWMSEDERMNIFDALSFALASTTEPLLATNGTPHEI
jgi:hypothetical protein